MTILVAEDEPSMRNNLSEILINEDYSVHSADMVEEAVELCRKIQPQIILMDVHVSGIDGVEAFRWIRCYKEGVRVILISAYSTEILKEATLDEGAIAILSKPVDLQKVIGLIEEVTKTTILVVSEEEKSIQFLRNELSQNGYCLTVVQSPHDAVELVVQIRFDLILLNTQLPAMNSLELYLAIKAIPPTSVAIMITGKVEELESVALEAVNRNAYTLVEKLLDIDRIVGLIKRLTTRRFSSDMQKPPLETT